MAELAPQEDGGLVAIQYNFSCCRSGGRFASRGRSWRSSFHLFHLCSSKIDMQKKRIHTIPIPYCFLGTCCDVGQHSASMCANGYAQPSVRPICRRSLSLQLSALFSPRHGRPCCRALVCRTPFFSFRQPPRATLTLTPTGSQGVPPGSPPSPAAAAPRATTGGNATT